jgi:hypothetical protein
MFVSRASYPILVSMSLFAAQYKHRKAHILRYTPSLTEYRKQLNESDVETALNVFTVGEYGRCWNNFCSRCKALIGSYDAFRSATPVSYKRIV